MTRLYALWLLYHLFSLWHLLFSIISYYNTIICIMAFISLVCIMTSITNGSCSWWPDAPKQLPLSLGFKCAHCGSEFESRAGMAQHRRNRLYVGTPCADPSNSKSMSFTARGDHSAGILRQHDTLGVLPIPAFFLAQKMLT